MSSAVEISKLCDSKGAAVALDEALRRVSRLEEEKNSLWNSRFFVRLVLEDGTKKLWPTTESTISKDYDLSDVSDGPSEYLYCDDDGQLYPVTVGKNSNINTDQENPVVYSASSLMANGKVVGTVFYTDH